VGVDSSLNRSVCVRRLPLSIRASGRVVGAGDGGPPPIRTRMPIVARSASLVAGKVWMNAAMRRASGSSPGPPAAPV